MYTVQFGDYELDMLPGAYMVMEEFLEITIPAEDLSLDYVESIIQDRNNLQLIQIFDARPVLVAKFEKIYTEYGSLVKNPHYLIERFDGEGNLNEKYGDVITIRVTKSTIDTTISKMQSDMEYIAIMSDIDIDEEE